MLERIVRHARRWWKLFVTRDPFLQAHRRWIKDRGDETLRVDYPLSPESVVLDVGGYNGDWAARIHERYRCRVYVFEPVPEFYERIRERFSGVEAVQVFNYGLSDADAMMPISLSADGSSVFHQNRQHIDIRLRDIDVVLQELGIRDIALIKMNIEGGEYALLQRMLDKDIVPHCRDIQIQFHDFVPDAQSLRLGLRERLARTHELTYDYYFIWENWRLKA